MIHLIGISEWTILQHQNHVKGKIVLNSDTLIKKLSQVRFMGFIGLMKKLKIGTEDSQKIWFFKISNFLKNEHLRLYSLPINVVFKKLDHKNILRIPDPRDFVIGVNFIRKKPSAKSSNKVQKKKISKKHLFIRFNYKGIDKIKKIKKEKKKEILMTTSGLFKMEKLKRKQKVDMFKKKRSLFASKKKSISNPRKKLESLFKKKKLIKNKSKRNSSKYSNKENLSASFFKSVRKSVQKKIKPINFSRKRQSLGNINKAYQRYKANSNLNFSASKLKRKSEKKTRTSNYSSNQSKVKKRRSTVKSKHDKSASRQSRSKMIEIDKSKNN